MKSGTFALRKRLAVIRNHRHVSQRLSSDDIQIPYRKCVATILLMPGVYK